MKTLKIVFMGLLFHVFSSTIGTTSELVHDFNNPAFSGNGYSSHVLSIEQLQFNRKKGVADDAKSAAAAAERKENNTTINKFIKNVESRIYANLSKQLVDNMFGTTIYWVKDSSTEIITLTITTPDGAVTTMSVPLGDFNF